MAKTNKSRKGRTGLFPARAPLASLVDATFEASGEWGSVNCGFQPWLEIGRTPKGVYSQRERSLKGGVLGTFWKPPSQNPF